MAVTYIWQLDDCWLVQIDNNDIPARQRFTLYHEIFHTLAHCKATPVFKRVPFSCEGSFNELLADHFATSMLIPEKWVRERWKKFKDVTQIAYLFNVSVPLMWLILHHLRLI